MIDLVTDVGILTCDNLVKVKNKLIRQAKKKVFYEETFQFYIGRDKSSAIQLYFPEVKRDTFVESVVRKKAVSALTFYYNEQIKLNQHCYLNSYLQFVLTPHFVYSLQAKLKITAPDGQKVSLTSDCVDFSHTKLATVTDWVHRCFRTKPNTLDTDKLAVMDFARPYIGTIKFVISADHNRSTQIFVEKVVQALDKFIMVPKKLNFIAEKVADKLCKDITNSNCAREKVYILTGILSDSGNFPESLRTSLLPQAFGIFDIKQWHTFLTDSGELVLAYVKKHALSKMPVSGKVFLPPKDLLILCARVDKLLSKYSKHKIIRQPL